MIAKGGLVPIDSSTRYSTAAVGCWQQYANIAFALFHKGNYLLVGLLVIRAMKSNSSFIIQNFWFLFCNGLILNDGRLLQPLSVSLLILYDKES